MTPFIIIASVILLLLFLMLLPLKLFFKLEDEDLNLHFGVLMFKFKLYPKKLKKRGEKLAEDTIKDIEKEQKTVNPNAGKKRSAKPSSSAPKPSPAKKAKKSSEKKKQSGETEERTWKETFFLMIDIVHSVVKPTKFLLRHLVVSDFSLHAVIGGEEPDETAVTFGYWNAAVYGGLATLQNFLTIKCKKISIAVDFTAPETHVTTQGILKIRVFAALFATVRMFFNIMVNTFKRAKENEEDSDQPERKAAA